MVSWSGSCLRGCLFNTWLPARHGEFSSCAMLGNDLK